MDTIQKALNKFLFSFLPTVFPPLGWTLRLRVVGDEEWGTRLAVQTKAMPSCLDFIVRAVQRQ